MKNIINEMKAIKNNFSYEGVKFIEWLEKNQDSETAEDFKTWYIDQEQIITNGHFTGVSSTDEFISEFIENKQEIKEFKKFIGGIKMTNIRATLDQDTNFLRIEEEENGVYVWRDVFSISRNFGILDIDEAEECIEMYIRIRELEDVHVERIGMERQELSIPAEGLREVGMRLDDFVGEHIFLGSEEEYGVRISPSGNVYLSIFYSMPYIREVSDTNESPLNFCNYETVIMEYDLRENTGFFRYRSRMPEMAIDYLEEALMEISRAIVW